MLPLREADRVFSRAHDFRRFLHKRLPPYLDSCEFPQEAPLADADLPPLHGIPGETIGRWPAADLARLVDDPAALAEFPINHDVPVTSTSGGPEAAGQTLASFIRDRLPRYGEDRNHPDRDAASRLSPYLPLRSHQAATTYFHPSCVTLGGDLATSQKKPTGKREGWWHAPPTVEAFLDEFVTWRELGFNMSWQRPDYTEYDSLPDWAKETLEEHADDPRDQRYTLAELESADTGDPIWNAAQRQLVRDGIIHNYMRMVWGKKIIQWTSHPREAFAFMVELNNKYALDGRDPNSYSGIGWCLGRYDRAWGPERPIFGKVRYMTSENTARKLQLGGYLEIFGP